MKYVPTTQSFWNHSGSWCTYHAIGVGIHYIITKTNDENSGYIVLYTYSVVQAIGNMKTNIAIILLLTYRTQYYVAWNRYPSVKYLLPTYTCTHIYIRSTALHPLVCAHKCKQ